MASSADRSVIGSPLSEESGFSFLLIATLGAADAAVTLKSGPRSKENASAEDKSPRAAEGQTLRCAKLPRNGFIAVIGAEETNQRAGFGAAFRITRRPNISCAGNAYFSRKKIRLTTG